MKTYERDGKKFIKFNGIEIQVAPEEDILKCDFHVCSRCEDGPKALMRAQVSQCTRCGKDIWYDPKLAVGPKKICIQCVILESQQESLSA